MAKPDAQVKRHLMPMALFDAALLHRRAGGGFGRQNRGKVAWLVGAVYHAEKWTAAALEAKCVGLW